MTGAVEEHPAVLATLRVMSRPVWLLLVGTLINRLGNFLQIYLVLYLVHQGFSATGSGLALGAYGVGSMIGVLVGGSISDRLGYRRTIVGSMMVAGALTASVPHLSTLTIVILVAGVIGIAAQAYRPASAALLIEVTPQHQHIMVFAVYRLAYNLGTVLGPLLGAVLIRFSYVLIFYGNAAATLAFGLLALALPRLAGTAGHADSTAAHGSRQSYSAVLADVRFLMFMLALFLNSIVYVQSISTLPLQVTASGYTIGFYAVLLSINALVVTCLELPFTKFVQRMPDMWAVAIGNALVGVGMNLYLAGPTAAMFIVATVIWTMGEMIGTPTFSAYPGRVAPSRLRARYIAAAEFSAQIGYSVGPVLGSVVWAVWPAGVWWLSGLLGLASVVATFVGMAERNGRAADRGSATAEHSTADTPPKSAMPENAQ